MLNVDKSGLMDILWDTVSIQVSFKSCQEHARDTCLESRGSKVDGHSGIHRRHCLKTNKEGINPVKFSIVHGHRYVNLTTDD